MRNDDTAGKADAWVDRIYTYIRDSSESGQRFLGIGTNDNQPRYDLVLDIKNDAKECWYYFACHETRVVFWADSFKDVQRDLLEDLEGVTAEEHLGELCAVTTEECAQSERSV